MFDIAVVLINYNSARYSIDCIESIVKETSAALNYQIIVTDNNSQIDDYRALQKFLAEKNYPHVELHRSRINTGFGGGNMHGAQQANAKYLAFINNDVILKNDCLSIMKQTLEERPEIGIAGGQAFDEHGRFMISIDHFASPAREILGRKFLESARPRKYPKRKQQYTSAVRADFIPGSFMFLRAADFYAVGGFDTNIFLYYEETDLCRRLAKHNKYAYLIPQAAFVHFHGGSTPRSIEIKKELKISLLYIMRKHYGVWGHRSVLIFLCVKYFFSSIVKFKNIPLLRLMLVGAPLSKSLKQRQTMSPKI